MVGLSIANVDTPNEIFKSIILYDKEDRLGPR